MRIPQVARTRPDTATASRPTLLAALIVFVCSAVAGLALTRLLYEWQFPQWLWLARPMAAMALGLAVALVSTVIWWQAAGPARPTTALLFLPLLLNLVTVLSPQAVPLQSRLFFAASAWLSLLLTYRHVVQRRQVWHRLLFLAVALLPIYLLTMGRTVGRADTFEFQVVIPRLGIVHPTGYPLYLLLGKLFTFIPLGSVAWRINLASAVFALGATAFLFLLARRLLHNDITALLAAVLLGLLPTFWSQAIEAEVYTLHALIVLAALYLMALILDTRDRQRLQTRLLILALLLGLGLTNHLTTIILLPAALLSTIFVIARTSEAKSSASIRVPPAAEEPQFSNLQSIDLRSLLPKLLLAFLLPLLLYAYLPLRWAAVNGEPMGLARFLDWVIGGRFQGALNLSAWLQDPARYAVVGRLLAAEWQPTWLLAFSLIGSIYLLTKRWRVAAILALTAAGYTFYGLSYYVPDLSVFILPLHLILALLWGLGLAAVGKKLAQANPWRKRSVVITDFHVTAMLAVALALIIVPGVARTWPSLDRSQADGGTQWARGVLNMPLPDGGAILADSEKFPPLYYLQQAEGVRPDLDIVLAPDEAAYRAELSARLGRGQTVYLARFIPGLEGQYYLRSQGPLVRVATEPLAAVPPDSREASLAFGPVQLVAYDLVPVAAVDPTATALTLYWQAQQDLDEALYVYTRWRGQNYVGQPIARGGQHPAGNYYPTVAWRAEEVVADFHLLPRPLLNEPQTLTIEVALGAPFSAPQALEWQAVAQVPIEPVHEMNLETPTHMQIGSALIEAAQFPAQARPGSELTLLLSGCGNDFDDLHLELAPADAEQRPQGTASEPANQPACKQSLVRRFPVAVGDNLQAGPYALRLSHPDALARCRWLAPLSTGCRLGVVEVSGVALPEGATNYDDKIALLEVSVSDTTLEAGGQLTVDLTWQALAPISENYTVFVQLVNAQDQIVGQVDSWPLQGTYPTSQWRAGEVVEDSYHIQLPSDVSPGRYRLLIGWYLLATQQRLPVLDESGAVVEDRLVVPGLTVQ